MMAKTENPPSMRKATDSDLALLVRMNIDLVADERYDRPMKDADMAIRMDRFIHDPAYAVYVFEVNGENAGYAVVELEKSPLYLRHFFIQHDFRRSRVGTRCFHLLLETLKTDRMDLDVMIWNERGCGFWKSLGFRERCIMMTYGTDGVQQ